MILENEVRREKGQKPPRIFSLHLKLSKDYAMIMFEGKYGTSNHWPKRVSNAVGEERNHV
jgi:hypothetical protein